MKLNHSLVPLAVTEHSSKEAAVGGMHFNKGLIVVSSSCRFARPIISLRFVSCRSLLLQKNLRPKSPRHL